MQSAEQPKRGLILHTTIHSGITKTVCSQIEAKKGKDFHNGLTGIRSIYGLSGADSIPVLEHAIKAPESMTEDLSEKEIQKYKDGGARGYWTPTRANAIRPLYQLLAMAKMRPDAEWSGD